jgi:toxin FitB
MKAGDTCLSVLTLGEIRKGIELLRIRDETQADVIETWLDDLRARFAGRILPVDVDVSDAWGRMNASSPKKAVDSLLAATARVHGLTVVTRNVRDFRECGVPLVDPFA